jgi:hypothetical protein
MSFQMADLKRTQGPTSLGVQVSETEKKSGERGFRNESSTLKPVRAAEILQTLIARGNREMGQGGQALTRQAGLIGGKLDDL